MPRRERFSEVARRNPRLATALWFGATVMIGTAVIMTLIVVISNDTTPFWNLQNLALFMILPGLTSGMSGAVVAMAGYPLAGSGLDGRWRKAVNYGGMVALISCVLYLIAFDAQDSSDTAGMWTFAVAFVICPIIFIVSIASSLALAAMSPPRLE